MLVLLAASFYLDLNVYQENATRKIHSALHPGPEWRIFHILTSEDIDDVISPALFHGYLCKQSVRNGKR